MSTDILIGSKLKILREFRNLTQADVASKLNISPTAYSRLELNQSKLGIDQAQILAEIFQVSLPDLISNDSPIISFVNKDSAIIEKGYIHNNYESQKDDADRLIAAKDQELETVKKYNKDQQEMIKSQQEQIKTLQDQILTLTSALGDYLKGLKQ